MQLSIHTDGGARGNPGPAAIGVVIEKGKGNARLHTHTDEAPGEDVLSGFGKRIGEASNNVAEYRGVIEALHEVKRLHEDGKLVEVSSMKFYLDSTLVVNQLNGTFKVKKAHLRELLMEIRQLEAEVGASAIYIAVPREKNTAADFFVNQALDSA